MTTHVDRQNQTCRRMSRDLTDISGRVDGRGGELHHASVDFMPKCTWIMCVLKDGVGLQVFKVLVMAGRW